MKRLLIFLLCMTAVLPVKLEAVDLTRLNKEVIKVTAEGEVLEPGIYELEPYTSIQELLELCGISDNADLSGVNLQMILKDKDVVYIPRKKEEHRISINSADLEELCLLPGIGPNTAEKIIEYRNEHGLFQTLDELQQVKGIGEKKFTSLQDYICL